MGWTDLGGVSVTGDNVGIGSQAPASKVHIVGNADQYGTVRFQPDGGKGPNHSHVHWDPTGDWYIRSASGEGKVVIQDSGGFVGVGTAEPDAKLAVLSRDATPPLSLRQTADDEFTRLRFNQGTYPFAVGGGHFTGVRTLQWDIAASTQELSVVNNLDQDADVKVLTLTRDGNVGVGTDSPAARLDVNGDLNVSGTATVTGDVKVTGDVFLLTGGDCAEAFDVIPEAELEPGTVLVLGADGLLEESQVAYDRRVAGVVSGAGSLKPAITLNGTRSETGPRRRIALVGQVYCKADAQYGAIGVGDLLTTSPTPGHAMRASETERAFGAILGKAMESRESGRGLLRVLVGLQ